MARVRDTKSFIEKAKSIHGQYRYDETIYIDSYSDVRITCKKHGVFSQRANNHLSGKGCPTCAIEARPDYKTVSKKELLSSGLRILSKVKRTVYAGERIQVECAEHGEFTVKASSAVKGCHLCIKHRIIKERTKNNVEVFKARFLEDVVRLYGDQFDCSKIDYVDARTAVVLICKEHGEFKASPNRLTGGKSTGNLKKTPCPGCRKTGHCKIVTVGDKRFQVRGFEDRALRVLIEEKGIDPEDIVVGKNVPKIPIHFRRKSGRVSKMHWPDIYIKSKDVIVEVKSTGTFGLTTFHGDSSDQIRLIQHKSKRAKALGYNYKVMLFSGQKKKIVRLPLPRDWDSISEAALRRWFKQTSKR